MPTNDFLPFASSGTANVLSQADYAALAARGEGFSGGIAKSQELNKVWRQTAAMSAMLGAFVASKGQDALDNGQAAALLTSFDAAIRSAGAPAGSVMFFAANAAPAGWIKANGATVSRTAYAALFAAIGTTFGSGDGSTTFVLPDLRAEVLRGWDDGRGVDVGRAFGSAQGDAIRNITGTFKVAGSSGGTDGHTGAFAAGAAGSGVTAGGGGGFVVDFSAARVVPTANENRMRNVALLACIKY